MPLVLVVTVAAMKVTRFKPDVEGDEGMRRESLRVGFDFTGPVDKETSRRMVTRATEYLEARREELGLRDIYSFYVADGGGITLFFDDGVVSRRLLPRGARGPARAPAGAGGRCATASATRRARTPGPRPSRVTISGEETELLQEFADEAKRRLAADRRHRRPEQRRRPRARPRSRCGSIPTLAGRFGVAPATISQIMGLTYRGVQLPRLQHRGQARSTWWSPCCRKTASRIENLALLTVGAAGGQAVHLDQVADFEFGRSPERIFRQRPAHRA